MGLNLLLIIVCVIFVAPRDLVVARYWKQNTDGSYVVCLDSVDHREYPVREGFVRYKYIMAQDSAAYILRFFQRGHTCSVHIDSAEGA